MLDEIERLGASRVVIVGGLPTISDATQAAIDGLETVTLVERLGGADRFASAAVVSEATYPSGATDVLVATGADFPDALAGGPAAGALGAPLLLTRQGCVPGETLAQLVALGARDVVILGSSQAVGTEVESFTAC